MRDLLNRDQIIGMCSALGYTLKDFEDAVIGMMSEMLSGDEECFEQLHPEIIGRYDSADIPGVRHRLEIGIRTYVQEYWHALNRVSELKKRPNQLISNGHVDWAIAHTLAWLKYHREDRERQGLPTPEYGVEYK